MSRSFKAESPGDGAWALQGKLWLGQQSVPCQQCHQRGLRTGQGWPAALVCQHPEPLPWHLQPQTWLPETRRLWSSLHLPGHHQLLTWQSQQHLLLLRLSTTCRNTFRGVEMCCNTVSNLEVQHLPWPDTTLELWLCCWN